MMNAKIWGWQLPEQEGGLDGEAGEEDAVEGEPKRLNLQVNLQVKAGAPERRQYSLGTLKDGSISGRTPKEGSFPFPKIIVIF